jgi:hypothetical protein
MDRGGRVLSLLARARMHTHNLQLSAAELPNDRYDNTTTDAER